MTRYLDGTTGRSEHAFRWQVRIIDRKNLEVADLAKLGFVNRTRCGVLDIVGVVDVGKKLGKRRHSASCATMQADRRLQIQGREVLRQQRGGRRDQQETRVCGSHPVSFLFLKTSLDYARTVLRTCATNSTIWL